MRENVLLPTNWGIDKKIVVLNIMEYYCVIRNDEQADFRKTWTDLYGLMQNEARGTRITFYTVTATLCDNQF